MLNISAMRIFQKLAWQMLINGFHKIHKIMNPLLMFILLIALGGLCYLFFFKCVDWFGKI